MADPSYKNPPPPPSRQNQTYSAPRDAPRVQGAWVAPVVSVGNLPQGVVSTGARNNGQPR